MKMYGRLLSGLLLTCVALVGCGKKPGKEPEVAEQAKPKMAAENPPSGGEPTPQAVFEAMVAANAALDYKAFINAFSPAYQMKEAVPLAYNAVLIWFGTRGSPEGDAKLRAEHKPVLDVLVKHGLTAEATMSLRKPPGDRTEEEKQKATLAGMIKDPAALWADLKAGYAKMPEYPDSPNGQFVGLKISDVKIIGDRATGFVMQQEGGKGDKFPIVFIKVQGKWKLAPEEKP